MINETVEYLPNYLLPRLLFRTRDERGSFYTAQKLIFPVFSLFAFRITSAFLGAGEGREWRI